MFSLCMFHMKKNEERPNASEHCEHSPTHHLSPTVHGNCISTVRFLEHSSENRVALPELER